MAQVGKWGRAFMWKHLHYGFHLVLCLGLPVSTSHKAEGRGTT